MEPTFVEIKKAAKNALRTRWPEAIFSFTALVAVMLLNSISQSLLMTIFKVEAVWSPLSPADLPQLSVVASVCITLFSAAFSLFITFPFLLGIFKWFWSATNQSNAMLSDIFYFFSSGKQFRKAVFFGILIYWRILITVILCYLPYIIFNILQSPEFYGLFGATTPIAVSTLFPVVYSLHSLAVVAVLILSAKYLLFGIVLCRYPELTAKASIRKGVELLKGESLRFIGFILSFAGWIIACLLLVPVIFVGPYFMASISVYGREILRQRESKE